MKVFTVDEPVFKIEPLFVLGCSSTQLARYLRRRFKVDVPIDAPDSDMLLGRMFTLDCAPWRIVWTRELSAAVAMHEVFHLVTRVCSDRGIAIRSHNERGESDDETAAYLFEFFTRAVLHHLRGCDMGYGKKGGKGKKR